MMIVLVRFEVGTEHQDMFRERMLQQAQQSLERESGCKRFDVAVDPQARCKIMLYEVYESQSAFAAHLESAHFNAFDAETSDWVVSKSVEIWEGPLIDLGTRR